MTPPVFHSARNADTTLRTECQGQGAWKQLDECPGTANSSSTSQPFSTSSAVTELPSVSDITPLVSTSLSVTATSFSAAGASMTPPDTTQSAAMSTTASASFPPTMGISCPSSSDRIYTAPNGKEYQVQCGVDHDDMTSGNLASSLQPSYEMCAQFCSGNEQCFSFTYRPNSGSDGVNCYLKKIWDHAVVNAGVWGGIQWPLPTSTTSATASSSATTSTETSTSPTSWPSGVVQILFLKDPEAHVCKWKFFQRVADNHVLDVCDTPPNQTDPATCGKPVPKPPMMWFFFDPWGQKNCTYYPDSDSSVLGGNITCNNFYSPCIKDPQSLEVIPCLHGVMVPRVICQDFPTS